MGNTMGLRTVTSDFVGPTWLWHRAAQLLLCAWLFKASLRIQDGARGLSFGALWLVPLLDVTSYYYVLLVLLAPWALALGRRAVLTSLGVCLLTQLLLVTATELPDRSYYVIASVIFTLFAGIAAAFELAAQRAPTRSAGSVRSVRRGAPP
jgi:hypothetical protein